MPAKDPYPGKKTNGQVQRMWSKSVTLTSTLITSLPPWVFQSAPYIKFKDNDRVPQSGDSSKEQGFTESAIHGVLSLFGKQRKEVIKP